MISGRRVVLVVLVVLATIVTPVSAAEGDDPEIVGVTFGNNSIEVRENVTFLWQTDDHRVLTNVTNTGSSSGYELCAATTPPNGTSTKLGCTPISHTGTETISVGNWPGPTGRQEVTLTVRSLVGNNSIVANQTAEVYVMAREADEDGDSLSNQREVDLGTDFLSVDTDGDGIEDGAEVTTYETDPLNNDTDDDGLLDGMEVRSKTNATDPDTDGDGLLDGLEVDAYATNPVKTDTDGDGLSDGDEVNRYGTNPAETDTDGDGLSDGDEVNRYGTNPVKVHTDGDGLSDGTEVALGTWPGSPLDVVLGGLVAIILLGLGARSLRHRRTGGETSAADAENEARQPPRLEPDEERILHSDEERILNFLLERDGSIPQKELVESTEWSSSKVSRLLSKMDEEGLVTKTTIGRENYIQLVDDKTGSTSDE